jgi:peptidyl-dipeptidase A
MNWDTSIITKTYSNPDVPIILRSGANRAYHEAMGSMMGLAALQKPFLEGLGMVQPGVKTNDTLMLMRESLDFIVHIPWGSGVMTEFEYELYSQIYRKINSMKAWWKPGEEIPGNCSAHSTR